MLPPAVSHRLRLLAQVELEDGTFGPANGAPDPERAVHPAEPARSHVAQDLDRADDVTDLGLAVPPWSSPRQTTGDARLDGGHLTRACRLTLLLGLLLLALVERPLPERHGDSEQAKGHLLAKLALALGGFGDVLGVRAALAPVGVRALAPVALGVRDLAVDLAPIGGLRHQRVRRPRATTRNAA